MIGSIPAMVIPPPKGKLNGGTGISEQMNEIAVASAIIMLDSVKRRILFVSFIFNLQKKFTARKLRAVNFMYATHQTMIDDRWCAQKSPYAGIIRIRLRVQGIYLVSAENSAPLFLCGFDVSQLYINTFHLSRYFSKNIAILRQRHLCNGFT